MKYIVRTANHIDGIFHTIGMAHQHLKNVNARYNNKNKPSPFYMVKQKRAQ